jgi:Spy/CpxP family protein refolding chaperone
MKPSVLLIKRSVMLAALLWAGAVAAQTSDAPAAPGPEQGRETAAQRMNNLATLLDLTDAQKTQVDAVLNEERAKMQAAREAAMASGTRPTFEQMKTEHAQLQQDTIAKLTGVLSPAQLKKFQVLLQERDADHFGRHRGPPGQNGAQQ